MSKRTEVESIIEEVIEGDPGDIEDVDYGFIFGPDGELKFAFVPEVLPWKPPKNIAKIMKILGVTDLSQLADEDTWIH